MEIIQEKEIVTLENILSFKVILAVSNYKYIFMSISWLQQTEKLMDGVIKSDLIVAITLIACNWGLTNNSYESEKWFKIP